MARSYQILAVQFEMDQEVGTKLTKETNKAVAFVLESSTPLMPLNSVNCHRNFCATKNLSQDKNF